jgi:hypothetical protein
VAQKGLDGGDHGALHRRYGRRFRLDCARCQEGQAPP